MGKKGTKSVLNTSSAADSKIAKMSSKEKGKAIGGNPDETDYRNMLTFIEWHEQEHPGLIRRMRQQVEIEMRLSGLNKHAELSKDSELIKGFWLPETLQALWEKAYPSLYTNKKHAQWFCNKFPIFSFADAAKSIKR